MSTRSRTIALFAALALALPTAALTPAFAAKGGGAMKMLDPDGDGTVDMKEVEAAADAKFAKLDPDGDGTIDRKEAKGKMSGAEFKQGDPDGDGTIDKKEFLGIAEALFKQADPDGDGTLDAKELNSKPGKMLIRLLK